MSQYLQEAFKQFKLLEGEEFDIDDSGIEDMKSFIDNDEATDFTDIIDPEAETEEDLEDSYIGKIILDCHVCHSKIYKNAEDVDYNEETGIANEGEECPFCYSVDGFEIVGQVAPYQETEVDVDVEPKEDEVEDSIEISTTGKKGFEAAGAAMDAFEDRLKDESFKSRRNKRLNESKRRKKSLKENLSNDVKSDISEQIYNIFTDLYHTDGFHPSEEDFDKAVAQAKEMLIDGEAFFDDDLSFDESFKEGLDFKTMPIPKEGATFAFSAKVDQDRVLDIIQKNDLKYSEVSDNGVPIWLIGHTDTDHIATYVPKTQTLYTDTREAFRECFKEGLENLDIETEHDKIHVSAEEKEPTGEEVIAPVEPAQETTILNDEPPAEEEGEEEVDFDFDDFDEEPFDTMGESYLKKVYENVDSFKTNKVRVNGNQLVVEGIIRFKSGKDKKTSFKFEAKDCDKKGNVRFIGENLQISRGKKSFSLRGSINENKLTPNQLKYNYTVNGNRVSGKVIAEAKKKVNEASNVSYGDVGNPVMLSNEQIKKLDKTGYSITYFKQNSTFPNAKEQLKNIRSEYPDAKVGINSDSHKEIKLQDIYPEDCFIFYKKNKKKDESLAKAKKKVAKSVNENWTDAFEHFSDIVDKYFPDEEKIESEIENIYNQHKGEPDYEEAWSRWCEGAEDDYEECLKEGKDLSKVEGSMTKLIQDNHEMLDSASDKIDLLNKVKKLFNDNNLNTTASKRLLKNIASSKSLASALQTVYNSMLAGSKLSVNEK